MFDKTEYQRQYRKERLKRIGLDVPIDKYNEIKTHTDRTHESVNGFIKRAINEAIEHDSGNDYEVKTAPREETKLLSVIDNLNQEGKKKVIDYASDLSGNPEYKQ